MDDCSLSAQEAVRFGELAAEGCTATMIAEIMSKNFNMIARQLTYWRQEHGRSHRSDNPGVDPRAEARMIQLVLADGGYPRAELIPGLGTVWIGVDGRPWRGPAAATPAKPEKASRAA